MLTSHPQVHIISCSSRRQSPTACKPQPSRTVCAAAAEPGRAKGWHWPFSSRHAAEETEIVYVTDTADADEVIEEPEDEEAILQHQQGQLQAQVQQGVQETAREAAAAAQHVPEPTAAAVTAQQALQQQQLQLQQQQQQSTDGSITTTTVARPAFASSSLTAPAGGGYWATAASGWVVALSLLAAVRQGRAHADAARLDVRALQARQQDSRIQSRELKEKRAQFLQQEQLLKEEAATKRLAEQAKEAEKARREAAAKAAEYERAAMEELQRTRARRAAAKKAFEESQGKLQEELATRTAREIALRQEAEARKAAEEAEKRAAAAAEAARAAAATAAAAEAADRAAKEAAAAKEAMKQQLRNSSCVYQLQLQGTAKAAPITAGGRQPQLSVTLTLLPGTSTTGSSSSSGGRGSSDSRALPPPVAQAQCTYDSPEAATDGAAALAVQAARQVYVHYIPAVTEGVTDLEGMSVLQNGGSSAGAKGVLLSEADNILWRRLLLAQLEAAGRQAIGQVAPLAASGELQQDLNAKLLYSALPQSDSNSLQQRLQQCAGLVSKQQLPAAIQLLDDIIEWQLEDFTGVLKLSKTPSTPSSGSGSSLAGHLQQLASSGLQGNCPASPYVVPACVYSVLLDLFDPATQAINRRRGSSSGSNGSSGAEAMGATSPSASPGGSASSSPGDTTADNEDMFDAVHDAAAGTGSTSSGSSGSASAAAVAALRRSIVSDSDSPLQRLAKFQLEQLEKAAPADELASVAACLRLLLGSKHPVAAAMQVLAERNMSARARQARAVRQQQKQLMMATELLKGSAVAGPGGLDPQNARLRQQLVPAPERIWALRNVANSMLRSTASSGGGGSRGSSTPSAEEAVSMLKQASDLAAEHYGSKHPGCLSALLDYTSALLAVPGHHEEAKAAIEAVCGIVAAVGERYRQQRDLLSLVLLYESTQAELDVPEVLGRQCVAMNRLQRQAADAFSVLETSQASKVMVKRKLPPDSPASALRQLARDCSEQLGVYAAVRKRDTRLDQWNKGLPLAPLS